MAHRRDLGTLRPPRRTADGRLIADGYLTRTGVFEYLNHVDGKIRREYRPPEQVFAADSLATLEGAPITNDHPGEPIGAGNARYLAVGALASPARRDGTHVAAGLSIYDAETIAAMEAGKSQLSCGYDCDLVFGPGVTPDGEHYDATQTNIRYNHVAVVERGRAGTARVRMDEARTDAAEMVESASLAIPVPGGILHGMDPAETAKQLANEKARADSLATQLETERARADALAGKVAGLEAENVKLTEQAKNAAKADEAEQRVTVLLEETRKLKERVDAAEAPDRLAKAVKERVAIVTAASIVLGGNPRRFDGLTDREVMVMALEKIDGAVPADKADEYVKAWFDHSTRSYVATEAHLAKMAEQARSGGGEQRMDSRTAREKMLERNRNLSRPKAE